LPVEQPTKFELVVNSQDGQTIGLLNCARAARPRQRGDRITTFFTAAQNVRFWHKADIVLASMNVRFWG
jgi:hypothetical protein